VRHWSAAAGEDLKRRWLWIVLRHEIDYRDPILPGDHVDGRALLGRADGPRYDRFVDLRRPRAGRPAAAVKSTWVLVEAASRKPKRVSAEIFEAFGVSG
jgi:acyl-CoA thioester hydrolase